MKAKRTAIIIFAVILSVVLSYTAAATVTLSSEYEGDGGFYAFSYAFSHLFTDPAASTFNKTAYKLFGVVLDKNISKGYDGYLFPVKTEGFDYAADIAGEAHYSDGVKAEFLQSLTTRRQALLLDGCETYVFVIPNSQTVLRDKLKTKNKNGVTAAQDLEVYLHDNGFENFYLLTDALKGKEYETYNNTENTVNGYGAYMIYKDIAPRLPESISRRSELLTLDGADISVSYSDGGALAKAAGIDKLIQNKNVSYQANKFSSRYTPQINGSLTVCALNDEYNNFIGRSPLLLQIPDGERALLMPLFSASYTDTVYYNSLSYSNTAVQTVKPTVNVYILREDRLLTLLDGADIKTYEAHIESAGEGGVTAAPKIKDVSVKQSGSAFVAGSCENGATVTVVSDKASVSVTARNGLFIAEIPADKGAELKIYAVSGAKEKSDTVKCTLPAAASSEESVFAGADSMLYYGETLDGYTSTDLYGADQLQQLKKRFEATLAKIRASSGKDTQILFLSAPNPLTIYPDSAAGTHYQSRAELTLTDQFKAALSEVDGVKFLDIREEMRQNTDIDKLYYQTDTHWTETGAYFGYRAIAEAAGQEPLPLHSFKTEEKTVPSGDLASFAGISRISETVRFLKPGTKLKAVGIANKPDTIDRSVYAGELESAVNDGNLPTAVMIRDSYSANLFPFICEHFSFLYCQRMWDYELNYDKITEIKPDYVIYVICERNLDNY